jgi:hypothetical protein
MPPALSVPGGHGRQSRPPGLYDSRVGDSVAGVAG